MLLIVRPYGDWIREHVIEILDGAGIATQPQRVVRDVPVDHLLSDVDHPEVDTLLVPFHAARDRFGRFTDGLDVLVAAYETGRLRHGTPIIMPVSVFALVAFEGKLRHQSPTFQHWFGQSVCVLNGPFGDHAMHATRVRAYLDRRAA